MMIKTSRMKYWCHQMINVARTLSTYRRLSFQGVVFIGPRNSFASHQCYLFTPSHSSNGKAEPSV